MKFFIQIYLLNRNFKNQGFMSEVLSSRYYIKISTTLTVCQGSPGYARWYRGDLGCALPKEFFRQYQIHNLQKIKKDRIWHLAFATLFQDHRQYLIIRYLGRQWFKLGLKRLDLGSHSGKQSWHMLYSFCSHYNFTSFLLIERMMKFKTRHFQLLHIMAYFMELM